MTGSPRERLLEAAVAGDRAAILTLMSAVRGEVGRYARRSCRTSSDAEEAVQDVLWVLYSRIGTLRTLAALSSWLFRLVERACRKLARKMLGFPSISDVETGSPILEQRDRDLQLDIAKAIATLPPNYRAVLLLRDVEGMSIDETSNVLSVTKETVKARLHRARGLVREHLLHGLD